MKANTLLELYVDGGSRGNPGPAASAYILKEPGGKTLEAKGLFLGRATNNVAEYTALTQGLTAAKKFEIEELHIFSDSELMVRQIIGEYRVKSPELKDLFYEVQKLLLAFDRWQIKHVRRELNAEADRLVNETLDHPGGGEEDEFDAADEFLAEAEEISETEAGEEIEADVDDDVNAETDTEADVKVLVEVVSPCGRGVCPAQLQKGQCFVFSGFVPAGLCIHSAQLLLSAVLALRQNLRSQRKPPLVKCPRPGCGATFKLSIL